MVGDGDACFHQYAKSIFRRLLIKYVETLVTISFGHPDWAGNPSIVAIKTIVSKEEILVWAVHRYPGWYGSDAEQDSGEGNGSLYRRGYEPSNVVGTSKWWVRWKLVLLLSAVTREQTGQLEET